MLLRCNYHCGSIITLTNADGVWWQAKCVTMQREREAVQTIMEQKIKVLVQSVTQSASQIMNESTSDGGPLGSSATGQALTRVSSSPLALVNHALNDVNNAAAFWHLLPSAKYCAHASSLCDC